MWMSTWGNKHVGEWVAPPQTIQGEHYKSHQHITHPTNYKDMLWSSSLSNDCNGWGLTSWQNGCSKIGEWVHE